MVDIYYPYFLREAAWEELRYSLRSIEKHLKTEYRVWIVGDLPLWINPLTVCQIPHERTEGVFMNTTYDAVTKLLMFCNHPDTEMYFIRMYDDIYLLSDVDLVDIGQFKAMYMHDKIPDHGGVWWEQLKQTIKAVRKKGYQGWNTETHLPELFNKEKMRWIIDIYLALENRLLTSTLYHNTFYPTAEPLLFSKDFAIQFYDNVDNEYYTSSGGDISKKCEGKKYLNHNNRGLTNEVREFLMARFPEKSKYEL